MDPSKLVSLIATLNPDNVPGRLAVIVRMGAAKLREKFPAFIDAVEEAGQVCVCVGGHAHTRVLGGGAAARARWHCRGAARVYLRPPPHPLAAPPPGGGVGVRPDARQH